MAAIESDLPDLTEWLRSIELLTLRVQALERTIGFDALGEIKRLVPKPPDMTPIPGAYGLPRLIKWRVRYEPEQLTMAMAMLVDPLDWNNSLIASKCGLTEKEVKDIKRDSNGRITWLRAQDNATKRKYLTQFNHVNLIRKLMTPEYQFKEAYTDEPERDDSDE